MEAKNGQIALQLRIYRGLSDLRQSCQRLEYGDFAAREKNSPTQTPSQRMVTAPKEGNAMD